MPTEIRHIVFTPEEIARAVVAYHRRSGNPLPAGNVLRCVPDQTDGQVTAALEMDVDSDGSRLNVPVPTPALAASLILFCINNRIPLPTQANKSLAMLNGNVSLVIKKMDEKGQRR
jgi:hypothetical protein